MNREHIWSGVFSILEKLEEFACASRTLVLWDQAPAYPAIYVQQQNETTAKPGRGLPNIYTMSAGIYVYIKNETDSDITPATQLNNLLDLVLNTLLPPNPIDCRQTLGGLVTDAWVEGEIQRDEGFQGGYGILHIPFKVLTSF